MFVICAVLRIAFAGPAQDVSIASDAEIREILADRIDSQRKDLGIVVGVIEPGGRRRVVGYGTFEKGDKRPVNGDTLFELGTVTEVFTALLLGDMAQRHEVALTDPVAKYLPGNVKVPERGRPISLEDLATHTSGLPKNPDNLTLKNSGNPYQDYTTKDLYQFLSSYALQRDAGSQWSYSNLGFGLLGHALSLRAHLGYDALVRTRITEPLGMKSTAITPSAEMKTRVARGHNLKLEAVSDWDFQVLAGAGGLWSTANDLLSFLGANLGYVKSPLGPAMAALLTVRRPTTQDGLDNALGWQVSAVNGIEIIQKHGATFGFNTFMGYDRQSRAGVVVLSNTLSTSGIGDIGLHLLNPSIPLRGAEQKEVKVDPKVFDRYTGLYQLSSTVSLTIIRQGDHLFAQNTGQPKQEVFPQSERNFFYKGFDAQLSFELNTAGRSEAVLIYYNGISKRAKRIEAGGPPPPAK